MGTKTRTRVWQRVPLHLWHESQDSPDPSWEPSLNPLADYVANDSDEDRDDVGDSMHPLHLLHHIQ